jgi:hypothetical protein
MNLNNLFESTHQPFADLQIGDPVIITGDVEYRGKTGDVREIGQDGAFVVVNLYNYGPYSFHASDVEYNDYADQEDDKEGMAEGPVNELKKSTVKSYADKKQAELDSIPPMPFKKPGMSRAEHEKAAKGMMGALARLSGKKPTSEGMTEAATPASVSKVLRLIERHKPEWFEDYGMGEVEDTVVDMAEQGQFQGMSAPDAMNLVAQELESMYGPQGLAEGSLDDIEDTKQFRDVVALAKTQKAIRQAKYGKDTKFYADGTPVTPKEVARRAAERKARQQGVAEGPEFDKWADDRAASQLHKLKPKKVQDRKTGKWYDPKKEFDKKMNSPEVMAQMKRMAQKEGVAEASSKNTEKTDQNWVDPKLKRKMDYAFGHYAGYKDRPEAFFKWVMQALEHSEQQDQEHAEQLQGLDQAISSIKKRLDSVLAQKNSQVAESRENKKQIIAHILKESRS